MILHSLHVTHWRSLLDTTKVGPFSDRLNVIYAPNGTGKSSLFEALRRALFDAHAVTGSEIESIRPWGRSLAPQVTVEFTHGGVRYRIEKTFLDEPKACLLRFDNKRFSPIADSRNAGEKLREILAAVPPGRGLSKQEHWGLSEILWAPQGALTFSSTSADLSDNVRAALGVQLTTKAGTQLEGRIEEQYLKLFTSGGKIKSGRGANAAPILELELQHTALVDQHKKLVVEHQRFEECARTVEDARQKRLQARRNADALADPLNKARATAATFTTLTQKLQQKTAASQAAKDRFDSIDNTIRLVTNARREISDFSTTIQKEESDLQNLATELQTATGLSASRLRTREDARQKRSSIELLRTGVEEARAFLASTQSRRDIASRIEKLNALEKSLEAEKQARNKVLAPDKKCIQKVRTLLTTRATTDATLQASLIRLTIRPLRDTTATTSPDGKTLPLPAGQETSVSGSPHVSVEIQGFGTIHATGPSKNVEALRNELADATRQLQDLTRPYGTEDPDELQNRRNNADALDQKINSIESRISELLNGDTRDKWGGLLAQFDATLLIQTGRHPAWKDEPPVISTLQADLNAQSSAIESAITQAESEHDLAQAALRAVENRMSTLDASHKASKNSLSAAQTRLDNLIRDGISDADRQAARQKASIEWLSAQGEVETCNMELAKIEGDPQKDMETLERQFKAYEDAQSKAQNDENIAIALLQTSTDKGTYSSLTSCEEQLADMKERISREQLRMNAIKLLHETVSACKSAAVAAVAAPVEQATTRMLNRIAGPRLGTVRLTDQFVPTHIQPATMAEPVDLKNLSGGEQEQLFLITRLALGQVLAKNERQLVVLDDVLNATDTGRFARMLNLLEEAADSLQIVVLTCHPERYQGLDKATFIDLQQCLHTP